MTLKRLNEIAELVNTNTSLYEYKGLEVMTCSVDDLFTICDELERGAETSKYYWLFNAVQQQLFKLLNMII